MKFLVEFNPPADVKNNFEKSPDLQKKVGEGIERMKPLAAWFTFAMPENWRLSLLQYPGSGLVHTVLSNIHL